jgi:hypothetical protein
LANQDEAIKQIMEQNEGKISLAILIDAAGKLEGEKTGEVAEGVGALIGGPEVDKYKIEEITVKRRVPVDAIVVKESFKEAIGPFNNRLSKAADATPALRSTKSSPA